MNQRPEETDPDPLEKLRQTLEAQGGEGKRSTARVNTDLYPIQMIAQSVLRS